MKSGQIQKPSIDDQAYLEIWKADQEFIKTRWSIVTFFMGGSFALFAYSFQTKPLGALAIRIFWFVHLLVCRPYRCAFLSAQQSFTTLSSIFGGIGPYYT